MPDSDELSEASAVSSSDETVKVSNTSAPATAVSEGEPIYVPATAASEGGSTPNIPAVSQDILSVWGQDFFVFTIFMPQVVCN